MPTSTALSANGQKGNILPYLLIILALLGGFWAFKNFKSNNAQTSPLLAIPKPSPLVYVDKDLGFQFEYPQTGFEVVADNEETYFKATATDHRKNFSGYVGYQPPKLIKGLMVMKKGTKDGPQYDNESVSVWVFDNPKKLTIDKWFDDYWYYPFIWGIFAYPGKGHIQPNQEATISGQPAKSVVVAYQPGQPEFTYVRNEDKMFMFRVIKGKEEKLISRVLNSFKFTK